MISMKRILFVLLLFWSFNAMAREDPAALPGPKGIFVYCGPALAKTFTYRVLRQERGGKEWQQVGSLRYPRNFEEFRGKLEAASLRLPFLNTPGKDEQTIMWRTLSHSRVADSLYGWAANPVVLQATGSGLWDNGIAAGTNYRYEVLQLDKAGKILSKKVTKEVRYPGHSPNFDIQSAGIKTGKNRVELDFLVNNINGLAGCRLFRQYYQQGPFTEIPVRPFFFNKNNRYYLGVIDSSATTRIPYRYFIVPYDEMGNEAKASDTVNVYDVTRINNNSYVTYIHARSDTSRHAIVLTWHLANPREALSVDIYRGISYDSTYQRISSVSPNDTLFTDRVVTPVTTYFYSIVVNGVYGRSMPSARVSAILHADRANNLPPQEVTGRLNGEVVTLNWKRIQPDTRGYYIYRSSNFTGAPKLIASILSSRDSVQTFTDSLRKLPYSPVYRYAIRSENSSYKLSPPSDFVTINNPHPQKIDVPAKITARYQDGKVMVVWDNVPAAHAPGGFRVERRDINAQGRVVEDYHPIDTGTPPGINYYADSTVNDGMEYLYRVRSIGFDNNQLSSPGLPASVFIPLEVPLPPAHVRVISTKKGVVLQWDTPLDTSIHQYIIYRAVTGGKPSNIKVLPSTANNWTDTSVKNGNTYFYYLVSVNNKKKESAPTQPVGIHTGN